MEIPSGKQLEVDTSNVIDASKTWKDLTERDLVGKKRIPEKDRNLESILTKDIKNESTSFSELQIRTKNKEDWWDDCLDKDHLYMAYTTFGPDENKYLMKSSRVGIKRWVTGPSEKYVREYMKNVVERRNPYVQFMRYRVKSTAGIIQIDSEWDGSSISDPINEELKENLESFLKDEMKVFEGVQTAKERGMAENSKIRLAHKHFEEKMRKFKYENLENPELHKDWFFNSIKETNLRTKEELKNLDVVGSFKNGNEEDYIKHLPTLTYSQVQLFLEREEIGSLQTPDDIKFEIQRRKLSDGRFLLTRVTKVKV